MKKFLSTVFSSCLGTILALTLILGILFAVGAISTSQDTSISKNSVILLNLEGSIPELTNNVSSDPFSFQSNTGLGLTDIVKVIDHAATNNLIVGIVMKNRWIGTGSAGLAEISRALERFKDKGKFVYAYADFYTQTGYTLATSADSIFLNKNGSVDLKGYAANIPFYKDMMDKFGIKMNVFYAGNFKSATEPYRRNDISEPNRQQITEFLAERVDILKNKIAENRNLSPLDIDRIMTGLEGRLSSLALENKLVDSVAFESDFEDFIKEKISIASDKKISYLKPKEYKEKVTLSTGTGKSKIALVIAEGEVAYGDSGHGVINETLYSKIFDKIKNDKDIKAVVYRINSRGGSAITSDILHHELKKLKASGIPVIASFGDYAASGGYYISAAADTIVAEPNSLTGSIGVFTMIPDATELLNDKIGIHYDTIKTHPFAIDLSPMLALTPAEKEFMNEGTQDIYKRFVEIVAEGRGLSIEQVKEIAQGRVWTGRKAKELGLVDELGGLERAFQIAAERANLQEYKVVTYPKIEPTFVEKIIAQVAQQHGSSSMILSREEQVLYNHVKELRNIAKMGQAQARLPFLMDEK